MSCIILEVHVNDTCIHFSYQFLSLKVATDDPMLYDYEMNADEFMVKPEVQNQI